MTGYGQRPGRLRRLISWCQRNPRSTAALATILVVLFIVGKATEKDDATPTAKSVDPGFSYSTTDDPAATPPASETATPTPSSVAPLPAAVSLVPADVTKSTTDASDLVYSLAVKGRSAKTGYSRAKFGTAWTDDNASPLGHNGCDTRNDILGRDLTVGVLKPGTRGCVVLAGTLRDPYTSKTLPFKRGPQSAAIQIDHVVALSNAWQTGAARWTTEARVAFANDPLNLLAVDGPTNEAKGDGDAATWLPPNKAYRCAYVARQVAVKSRYKLSTTQAEYDAMSSLLGDCPTQLAPTEAGRTPVLVKVKPKPAPKLKRTKVASTPAEPEPVGCTTTSSGNCIHGGQFCPKASYGEEGTDDAGRTYICEGDSDHPHWMIP